MFSLSLDLGEECLHFQVLERKNNGLPNLSARFYPLNCGIDWVESKENIDIRLSFDIAVYEVVEPEIVLEEFSL